MANSILIDAIDAAIALIEVSIENKKEARKVLVKGRNGKQEGRQAPK